MSLSKKRLRKINNAIKTAQEFINSLESLEDENLDFEELTDTLSDVLADLKSYKKEGW